MSKTVDICIWNERFIQKDMPRSEWCTFVWQWVYRWTWWYILTAAHVIENNERTYYIGDVCPLESVRKHPVIDIAIASTSCAWWDDQPSRTPEKIAVWDTAVTIDIRNRTYSTWSILDVQEIYALHSWIWETWLSGSPIYTSKKELIWISSSIDIITWYTRFVRITPSIKKRIEALLDTSQ